MRKIHLYRLIVLCFFCLSAKAQRPGAVIDVRHYGFNIKLSDESDTIKGKADVSVLFLQNTPSFQLNLVKRNDSGRGMLVSAVLENGKPVGFKQDGDDVTIFTHASKNQQRTFSVIYQGIPADGLIISTNKFGHRTFFGDNWPNRAHNWLPCVDDPADKAPVDFTVTAPDHYQVIANGLKLNETELPGKMKQTRWAETARLPTKVMVIGVADFAIDHPADVNGVPVYTYVFPENSATGFKSYAVATEILPFYSSRIGPYAYKKLANVQSKTIFGGMENASAIFYYENSVSDRGIEALMAHEIAHQWFGDAVSEKNFHHLWLSEGFATYLTNYYLENKYGVDTLKKRLAADRVKIFRLERTHSRPVVDTAETDYMKLLNANSYEKGNWVLHMLRRQLGDDVFWKGIRTYFAKYNGGNANTADFRQVMEQVNGKNLEVFFKEWLNTAGHPDLAVSWKYNAANHTVNIQVDQKQSNLYVFPLEVSVDGQLHTINMADRTAIVNISAGPNPPVIKVDPDVNLLASFIVTGN